jgi:hypothetical protein
LVDQLGDRRFRSNITPGDIHFRNNITPGVKRTLWNRRLNLGPWNV